MRKLLFAAALILIFGAQAEGAISFVSASHKICTQTSGATSSAACTLTAATTAGNLVVVAIANKTTTALVNSVTATSATFVQQAEMNNAGNQRVSIWTCWNCASISSITVNTSAGTKWVVAAEEYSGVLDIGTMKSATGNSTTPSVTFTTKDSNNFIVAALGNLGNGGIPTANTGNLRDANRTGSLSSDVALGACDNTVASAGSVTCSTTITSGQWTAAAIELRTVAEATGNTPTYIKGMMKPQETSVSATSYKSFMQHAGRTNNTILVLVNHAHAATPVTTTVVDDVSDNFIRKVWHDDGNQVLEWWCAPFTQNPTTITASTSSGASFFSVFWYEFQNIDGCNSDGFAKATWTTTTTIAAGSFTPTTNGDLIIQAAVQTSTGGPVTSFTQGASPWKLLNTDLRQAQVTQYQIQTTAAAINPTLTLSPSGSGPTVAIALKAANVGTGRPSGLYVVNVQGNFLAASLSSPVTLQFPTTGNALAVLFNGPDGHHMTAISDGNTNTWTVPTAAGTGSGSGDSQAATACNATTSTTMTGPTLTTTGADANGSIANLVDIAGALASSSCTDGSAVSTTGSDSVGNFDGVGLTTTGSNELVLTVLGVNVGTVTGMSPGNMMYALPNPLGTPDPVDEQNGYGNILTTTTGTYTPHWTITGGPALGWGNQSVAIKPPSSAAAPVRHRVTTN